MAMQKDDNRGITKVSRRITEKVTQIELRPTDSIPVHDMANTYAALDYERRLKTPEEPMTDERLRAIRVRGGA